MGRANDDDGSTRRDDMLSDWLPPLSLLPSLSLIFLFGVSVSLFFIRRTAWSGAFVVAAFAASFAELYARLEDETCVLATRQQFAEMDFRVSSLYVQSVNDKLLLLKNLRQCEGDECFMVRKRIQWLDLVEPAVRRVLDRMKEGCLDFTAVREMQRTIGELNCEE